MYVLCSDKLYYYSKKKKKIQLSSFPELSEKLSPGLQSSLGCKYNSFLFLKSPSCPKNKYIKNRKAKGKKNTKTFLLVMRTLRIYCVNPMYHTVVLISHYVVLTSLVLTLH